MYASAHGRRILTEGICSTSKTAMLSRGYDILERTQIKRDLRGPRRRGWVLTVQILLIHPLASINRRRK
nr:hypothetical protein SHINE37_41309 [Rhizobiaceae bacterium]